MKCDVWHAAEHLAMPLSAPWYPIDRPAELGSVRHVSDEPKLESTGCQHSIILLFFAVAAQS